MFAFQIHVVHYNTKYDSFKEAMGHPDGLAVLGAFLEVSPVDQPLARRGRSSGRVGLGWAESGTVLGTGKGTNAPGKRGREKVSAALIGGRG